MENVIYGKKIEQNIKQQYNNLIVLIREKNESIIETEFLKKIVKIEKTGERITGMLNEKDGKNPVCKSSKDRPSGFTDRANTAKNTIMLSRCSSVIRFQYIEKDSLVNDDNYIVEIISSLKEINPKYLFYSLLNLQEEIAQLTKNDQSAKSHPLYLKKEKIEEIYKKKIPIVPLEIQNEVVKILDGFKNLVNLIEK